MPSSVTNLPLLLLYNNAFIEHVGVLKFAYYGFVNLIICYYPPPPR